MKVTNEIPVIEMNGERAVVGKTPPLIVKDAWPSPSTVIVQIGKVSVRVNAEQLHAAITNAINHRS